MDKMIHTLRELSESFLIGTSEGIYRSHATDLQKGASFVTLEQVCQGPNPREIPSVDFVRFVANVLVGG